MTRQLELCVAHLTVVEHRTEALDDLVVELAPQLLDDLFTVTFDGHLCCFRGLDAIGETHMQSIPGRFLLT